MPEVALTCWLCGEGYDAGVLQTLCEDCHRPLRVNYDLSPSTLDRADLAGREENMWRYREVLPPCEPITLGEGFTPLRHAPRLGSNIWVKDESVNPTGSFKARGMSAAVSMAKKLGARRLAAPSAGNAAGALAAYAAAADLEAFVFMPQDTPQAFITECRVLGAQVELVDGLITDCGALVRERTQEMGWFDLSTLKEPYRVEGKKTMGYELAEQLNWSLPNAIIYPTGGGTGLVGMGKAFDEMEEMGWIGSDRPKMISVQAEGCQPIVTAFKNGERFADEHKNASTSASGLRVPKAVGDFIMLDLIRVTGGTALAVSDHDMISSCYELGAATGIFPAPEGGAAWAAAKQLLSEGSIKQTDQVVLFCTGSGLKYLEAFDA
jgi:threonine synthase